MNSLHNNGSWRGAKGTKTNNDNVNHEKELTAISEKRETTNGAGGVSLDKIGSETGDKLVADKYGTESVKNHGNNEIAFSFILCF